ncbi:MAG: SurA N-terminal domain-containing protein [Kiritimatiellae bacterium]|nr:SurA N-terminal domain-containing protein [Kiritimatiellia bacterium]
MKKAIVNGREIPQEAVQFELDRLVRFYMNHGMTVEEVKTNLAKLQDKALEQAIGARLLLDRAMQIDLPVTAKDIDAEVEKVVAQVGGRDNYEKALAAQGITDAAFRKELEKGAKVNMLVNQACAHVAEPTEEEVTAFYTANKAEYGAKTIVDVHDQIKDLLRHEARGRAMDIYVEELRESAQIEYKEGKHA